MFAAFVLAAALDAPVNPIVHVMIHVPMNVTYLAAYQTDLRGYGSLTDHVGTGTWTNSHDPAAPIVSERVDHIELTTDLRTARSFLPTFLRLLRIEQHQQETLGEIFGGSYGTAQQTRTRIVVRLASGAATSARMDRLHRIFANRGDGGDSCYVEGSVVIDYSGVTPRDAARIEAALTREGFGFTTEQETFVTDDAATP